MLFLRKILGGCRDEHLVIFQSDSETVEDRLKVSLSFFGLKTHSGSFQIRNGVPIVGQDKASVRQVRWQAPLTEYPRARYPVAPTAPLLWAVCRASADWLPVYCRISPVLPERPLEPSPSMFPLRVQGALAELG